MSLSNPGLLSRRPRAAVLVFGLLMLAALLTAIAPASAGPTTTVIDFETAPNGSPTTSGQQLTAYPAFGVTFENTVEVVQCGGANCQDARSGDRVVRTLLDGEFARHPLEISFADPRETVTLYVRLDADAGANGSEVTVVIDGYDTTGMFIGTEEERFTHNATDGVWHEISFHAAPVIARVEVWGGETAHVGNPAVYSQATNFLLFDDLTMESPPSATTTTAAVDDTPPQVQILAPSEGAVVTAPSGADGVTPLRVRASDDTGLDRVDLTITAPDGSDEDFNLCGRSPSPACSGDPWETHSTTEILLTGGEGRYTLTATACDLAGNCTDSVSVDVILEFDDAPPEVEALKVELNQGTQNVRGLLDVPVAGGTASITNLPRGTLIAGRDLVVRYYLVGIGGPRNGFSARLDVQVWQAGDSFPSAGRLFDPVGTADVPEDPADPADRDDLIWEMRGDLGQTLDFVVPAEVLEGAVTMDLELQGVGGHVQVAVQPAVTLGLHTIGMIGPDVTAVDDEALAAVMDIVRAQMPISELLFPNFFDNEWALDNGSITPFIDRIGFYPMGRSTNCGDVLGWVRSTYSGDTLPTENEPDYVVTLGVAGGGWLVGCLGKAYTSGTPTAITYADGNVAPHEIVHTMGVEHASDDHDEDDGGGFEPWPYPHGMMSPDGHSVFGVLIGEDAGSYMLTLVAPCLTDETDPSSTSIDCTDSAGDPLPDSLRMHEFMSYGPFLDWTGDYDPRPGGAFSWPSDVTYSRAYGVIGSGVLFPASGELASFTRAAGSAESRSEAWIVSGVVREDGTVELIDNPVRKRLPDSMIGDGDGPYTLELLDDAGEALARQSFDAAAVDGPDAQFWVAVPYVEGVASLEIQHAGSTIFELAASDNSPTVEVLTPNGGERFDDGTIEVTWEASDPDGDDLTFLVQYSPDNGQSWQGVTLTEGFAAEVDVGGLIEGQQAFVRVVASDGLNTAVDLSDGFFGVGNEPLAGGPEGVVADGDGTNWLLIVLLILLVAAVGAFGFVWMRTRRSPGG